MLPVNDLLAVLRLSKGPGRVLYSIKLRNNHHNKGHVKISNFFKA